MHDLAELKKEQIGLRLPKYLINDIDAFTKSFSINRTDIIVEAIKSYISEQKTNIFYSDFENSCTELKDVLSNKKPHDLQTLSGLIDEIKYN